MQDQSSLPITHNSDYLPFEVLSNEVVVYDQQEGEFQQFQRPFSDDITSIMLERIEKGFTITNYGKKIQERSIRGVWNWFKKIRRRLETITSREKEREKFLHKDKQKQLEEARAETSILSDIYGSILALNTEQFKDIDFYRLMGIVTLNYEKMSSHFKLLDWTHSFQSSQVIDSNNRQKWDNFWQGSYRGAAIWCLHLHFDNALQILKEYREAAQKDQVAELTICINFMASFAKIAEAAPGIMNLETRDRNSAADKNLEIIKFQTKLEFLREQIKMYSFQNPHLELIRSFLSGEYDLLEIMKDSRLAISDRIGFLLRFGTSKIKEVLEALAEYAIENGAIEFIVIFGSSDKTLQILQSFLDKTSDIQTGAIIAHLLTSLRIQPPNQALSLIYMEYIEFLNVHHLFQHRAKIEKEAAEIREMCEPKIQETTSNFSHLSCFYCKASLAHSFIIKNLSPEDNSFKSLEKEKRHYISYCPSCSKKLPNCCICLRPLLLLNPFEDLRMKSNKLSKNQSGKPKAHNYVCTFEKAIVWCQSCKHGGHARHLGDWFMKYNVCPVTDCQCQCNNLQFS